VTAETNSRIALFAGPWFHEGNESAAFTTEQVQIAKIVTKVAGNELNPGRCFDWREFINFSSEMAAGVDLLTCLPVGIRKA
jgi:hypothetical protein